MKHVPTPEESFRLRQLEYRHYECTMSIMVDCNFDDTLYGLRRETFANHLRSKWYVIDGEKKEEQNVSNL